MKHYIYADNAATTKLDIEAYEAMNPFLLNEYGNASQPYSFSKTSKKALQESRETIAKCIGALPEEIYFTSGGTESNNWAIKGLLNHYHELEIITSQIEHHSILNSCKHMENMGAVVTYLPVTNEGMVNTSVLKDYITNRTQLVSIMLANNEIGTIEPISEISQILHQYNAYFHTDAVQAVGHIPIDVNLLGVDLLSASAHKFNGPKGTGFLYIKKGTKLKPYINGGLQQFGMRAGTENIAAIVGMAIALKTNCQKLEQTQNKLSKMEQVFIETLLNKGVHFIRNGSPKHIPGNINISIEKSNGEMLLHRLDLKGIFISTGSACDSVSTRISHVIKAIQVPNNYAKGTIRISFGKNNDEIDAVIIANAIADILEK